ncbi:MAG: DUF1570 domain-containing protein [Pirellulales bacterium]
MQQWQFDRIVRGWTVLLGIFSMGCHGSIPIDSAFNPNLPSVNEPLIIHCDFVLPQQSRLVDQLVQQRSVLSEKLNLTLTSEPVHIYLFADEQAYYQFLSRQFPDFPPRRALFVETDTQLAIYAFWGSHVIEDLRHEVTHGYLHGSGFLYGSKGQLPLWLDEGLAEYFEVGRSYQGLHKKHAAFLQQQYLASSWHPNLARLESLQSASKMTQQDYAESWAWVHFLLETSPERQSLLGQYFADLRNSPTNDALSHRISKQLVRADLTLLEHLQILWGEE